ncbi:MAG: LuxR family transcriptional regulator [Frankiales bacterium]|nr:LuxR family transcriptional regulator [Frankiales bacterium]
MAASTRSSPISIALVDDYDVVLLGVARMLDQYRGRVVTAEIDSNEAVTDTVDIVLYDSFAQPESDHDEIAVLVANPRARRVVVYTWNFHPDLVSSALEQGADGYLSKTLPARELVTALEAVHAGEQVVSESPLRARSAPGLDWPGRLEGLTDRESEILALITQGKNNADVAALTYLSPNTIKSYIRSIYRKIGVASRTQAVLWGVSNGFSPDHRRIAHWRGGP